MRAAIASALTALAVLASAASVFAEEPKKEAEKKPAAEERQRQWAKAIQAALDKKDFDKVLSILDEVAADKSLSDNDRLAANYVKFQVLVKEKKDGAKASAVAKKMCEQKKDDAQLLNELAWTLLDTPDLKNRDFDVAMEIAKLAAEASKYLDGPILDTLARAYFEKGDLDKAIEYQTKAVQKCENNDTMSDVDKAKVKETLEKYQNKKAEKII